MTSQVDHSGGPSSTPPYLRIAAAIRQQIERGELAAGDPVPSTRALARRWKVASATAAHALGALAREGWIRAVPRKGTIVASEPERGQIARQAGGALTLVGIVSAAIEIADGEGLPALSLRGVAARVRAPVMSLYRLVGGKDDLLRRMTDAALGEGVLPAVPPHGWRAQLEAGARVEWRVFRRHPWLARVVNLTRPEPLPNVISYVDWVLRALDEMGVDAGTKMRVHVILHAYIQGIAVNVESEVEAASATGLSDAEWIRKRKAAFAALAASGRYPAFANAMSEVGDFDIDFDDLFERGLAALLDGFTSTLEGGLRPRASRHV